ncbi:MAG: hypothetical protein P9M00_07040 [Candidatus Tritonobacter lacicola]|nr:hypothetical protein [Candidatus Tritonobacter lacicola]
MRKGIRMDGASFFLTLGLKLLWCAARSCGSAVARAALSDFQGRSSESFMA